MKDCEDPVVIVNNTATVKLQLEVEVTLSLMDIECNTILIGPQREYSCSVLTGGVMLTSLTLPYTYPEM